MESLSHNFMCTLLLSEDTFGIEHMKIIAMLFTYGWRGMTGEVLQTVLLCFETRPRTEADTD
jgi:hypothetical protein